MGGQQQPVDDFAPRANLKRLFKDGAILSGDSEKVKGAASRYFCRLDPAGGYSPHRLDQWSNGVVRDVTSFFD
jgi:hypothetical protein